MNKSAVALPRPQEREFLPEEFKLTVWSRLKPYYQDLLKRKIDCLEDLERWIADRSELESVVSECFAWRYIKITINSSDEQAMDLYEYAVQELMPKIVSFENSLNEKLVSSPFVDQLEGNAYEIYLRLSRNAVSLFHKENIPLATEVQLRSKEHGKIFSEMTIGMDGKQLTLQKAGTILEETDRGLRETVYHKINKRILQDTPQLESLFDTLLEKRHEIALNAGFHNFRDYKFKALNRFDYSTDDCVDFHRSIAQEILPIIDELNVYRKKKMSLPLLRPWDLNVDATGKAPLKPFNNVGELVEKTIRCLDQIHPAFGNVIAIMREMGHLDLESRKGKRPGGYNIQLSSTGVPFIFMNATHSLNDMRTFLHESGHAIHSFLTRDLPLNTSRRFPSEVSELAAMSMELLSMDHWSIFFDNKEDLKRAKISQLENVLKVLPWIAAIDKFQHWLYTNPNHNRKERQEQWLATYREFTSSEVDNSELEIYAKYLWHKQLHIFEVPFYYIEYGMAQLGAIAIWKNYRENPTKAIADYKAALELGYTKPIGEIYERAGISFDFSQSYVAELGKFVQSELEVLIAS
jgi:oligoendopeptidase F